MFWITVYSRIYLFLWYCLLFLILMHLSLILSSQRMLKELFWLHHVNLMHTVWCTNKWSMMQMLRRDSWKGKFLEKRVYRMAGLSNERSYREIFSTWRDKWTSKLWNSSSPNPNVKLGLKNWENSVFLEKLHSSVTMSFPSFIFFKCTKIQHDPDLRSLQVNVFRNIFILCVLKYLLILQAFLCPTGYLAFSTDVLAWDVILVTKSVPSPALAAHEV